MVVNVLPHTTRTGNIGALTFSILMFLKQRKSSTDPRLRSLLQKATRRGCVEIVEQTSERLFELNDKTWLRSRAAVITFEECWPLAGELDLAVGVASKVRALKSLALREKQKDAAGLGALAFAYHEGDSSVDQLKVEEMRSLKIVSEALHRPNDFFDWVLRQCKDDRSVNVVQAANRYLAAATWGWDKACILAGALLASASGVPEVGAAKSLRASEFPYWVALDKHTPQGKLALRSVATQLNVPYRKIIWASFYFESAATNGISPSPWWEMEKSWRLKKAGMSIESAAELWDLARPLMQTQLANEAADLESTILHPSALQEELI
jgi:hypothetical protein